jgi:hypothetical protein
MLNKNVLLSLTQEEAETLAEYIFDLAEEHDDSKEDPAFDRLVEVHFKVTKALNEDKDWSTIEWHPISEKPKDESIILVKYHNGLITQGVVYYDENDESPWDCYGSLKNQLKEWAYLPEEE